MVGVYFSEELKAVEKYGYKIEPIQGIEFSKAKLFSEYIDHFYDIKKYSTGSSRWIAKLHLNTLYGIFGRKPDRLNTIGATPGQEWDVVSKYSVKSSMIIIDDLTLFLTQGNIDYKLLRETSQELGIEMTFNWIVRSNVAIAAAVTAYGRMKLEIIIKSKTIKLAFEP